MPVNRIRTRTAILAGLALMLAGIATFALRRARHNEYARAGHVVAYHVVDDDTAFVVWATEGVAEGEGVFLARVNSSGTTVWTREVPGQLPARDAIRISSSVVGVRYRRKHSDSEQHHSMIGFAYDGRQLWDIALTRSQVAFDGHKATSVADEHVGGAVIGDLFIEWAHTGSKWRMMGIDQRTGRQLFGNTIDQAPSAFYSTATHIIWEDPDREEERIKRALNPGGIRLVQLHSLDTTTGAMQHAMAAGRGCILDGNYVTAVHNASKQSLVAFLGGDVSSPTELAAEFDPLDEQRPFSLQSCGTYRGQLVFAIETVEDRRPELAVVIADRTAKPIRVMRLPFDTLRGLRGLLPGGHAQQAPLSGELSRFAPVILPAAGASSDDNLVMLDLDAAAVSWTARLGSALFTNLFGVRARWYLTNVENRRLNVSVFDGELGELAGAINGSPVEADAWFEQSLLPVHIGPRSVWLMSHDRTSITALPVTVLDTVTLRVISSSTRVRVKDMKNEVSARIARARQ